MDETVSTYPKLIRIVHWVSALVVIAMFAVGLWMVDLTYYSAWYQTAPNWHRSIGILLALLTLVRMGAKVAMRSPTIQGTALERRLAHSAHGILYLLLLTMFVSGYLISTADGRPIAVFNWFEVPSTGQWFEHQADIAGNVHYYAAWCLIVLAGFHALAALKHHFYDHDDTLKKMTGVSK
ncbi:MULTISPECIES: cytochrome b [unclassified Vibrio]|uniref:Cytochrome b n=1 Tax=Vibrio sp. HB236076 TaxID=3232307 RepID=A0AB39HKJ7_9VIBR|nr:cytochrome b [Vibrio sp. HB161653]MDP5252901.1 cytochrome b [Vibrio sp. HB161653]